MHDSTSYQNVESVLSLDVLGFPTGKDGVVWATFAARQAETIVNALAAQQILCRVREVNVGKSSLHLLHIDDEHGMSEAMDFIWRDSSGLRLKPDWTYTKGEHNRSFEEWLTG